MAIASKPLDPHNQTNPTTTMTNTKHTPGPWEILGADDTEGTHVSIMPPIFAQIASVKKFDNWQANARLIAAAPDMLEVLEAIDRIIEENTDPAQLALSIVARMADIRCAIRKATKP